MVARIACLSPYDEAIVQALFKGGRQVQVTLVPPPPARAEGTAGQIRHVVVPRRGTSGTLTEFMSAIQTGRQPESSGRDNPGSMP